MRNRREVWTGGKEDTEGEGGLVIAALDASALIYELTAWGETPRWETPMWTLIGVVVGFALSWFYSTFTRKQLAGFPTLIFDGTLGRKGVSEDRKQDTQNRNHF